MSNPVVRAVDVGYGHVKFTDGRNARGQILLDSFPSQSIAAPKAGDMDRGAFQKLDTFIIPVKDGDTETRLMVGKGIAMALQPDTETINLAHNYSLLPVYAARLFGALNYMYPSLPTIDGRKTIDLLVLGLPLNTFKDFHEPLARKFTGTFTINDRGHEVCIHRCAVFPQPLGSYTTFVGERKLPSVPEVLVVDPGFNSVDWFTCKGLAVNPSTVGAVDRGVSHVIRAIATELPYEIRRDSCIAAISRLIDESISKGKPFMLRGNEYDLGPYMHAGQPIIDEAASAVKNSIRAGSTIDYIVMTGGGAKMFMSAIQDRFPDHKVTALDNPAFSNVRGFQSLGEKMAQSASRAAGGAK